MMRSLFFAFMVAVGGGALAQDAFQIREAPSLTSAGAAQPGTILLVDQRGDRLADPGNGLLRFEDWERARPQQKQFLSPFPNYTEPTIEVTVNGFAKPRKVKLHMYVVEARFTLHRPAHRIDLARYANLAFLQRIDPAISHRAISSAEFAHTREGEAHNYTAHPERPWCATPRSVCIESRYQLEGKLPLGIRLANKLEDSGKKIAEHLEFQSELRLLSGADLDQNGFARLTGLDTPISGALEQTVFFVNQILRFGKFLAVAQQHPVDPGKSAVTVYIALAIKSDVLERKKEYERVPVLRNLVPAQVLVGNSSFNTGNSISAGLPSYARNQIRMAATIMERE